MPATWVTLKPNGGDELSLDEPVYHLGPETPDWGDSGFEVDLVEGTEIIGAARGAVRQGTRQVVLPIMLKNLASGEDYLEAANALDLALSQLAEKGGTIARQTIFDDGTADTELEIEVLSGSHNAPADWVYTRRIKLTATFTCQPRWLAPWAEVASVEGSTDSVIDLAIPELSGSMFGPGRIVISDQDSTARRFVELSGSFAHYDAGAEVEYRAAEFSLTGTDGSLVTTSLTGRIGPNTISASPLFTAWRTVGYLLALPQRGTYRVRARAYCAEEEATVTVRISVRSGSGAWREVGQAALPAGGFYDLDVGTIRRYDEAETMDIRVEAKASVTASNTFYLNLITVSPSEVYGVGRGFAVSEPSSGAVAYEDASETAADVGDSLNGETPSPLVETGNWATSGAAGGDFVLATTADKWERVDPSPVDGSPETGRFALISSVAKTTNTVTVDGKLADLTLAKGEAAFIGALVRFVDSTHFAVAGIRTRRRNDGRYYADVVFFKKNGAPPFTKIASIDVEIASDKHEIQANGRNFAQGIVSVTIDTAGNYAVYTGTSYLGSATTLAFEGTDSIFATSGTLDDGKAGVYSFNEGAGETSFWTASSASIIPSSHYVDVVREDGTAWITYESAVSADPAGDDPQALSSYQGRRIWLPPRKAGRISVKARSSDSEVEVDTGYDHETDITVYHRPAFAHISDTLEDA